MPAGASPMSAAATGARMGGTASASAVSDWTARVMATVETMRPFVLPLKAFDALCAPWRSVSVGGALKFVSQRHRMLARIGPNETMIPASPRNEAACGAVGALLDVDDFLFLLVGEFEIYGSVRPKLVEESLPVVGRKAFLPRFLSGQGLGDDPGRLELVLGERLGNQRCCEADCDQAKKPCHILAPRAFHAAGARTGPIRVRTSRAIRLPSRARLRGSSSPA